MNLVFIIQQHSYTYQYFHVSPIPGKSCTKGFMDYDLLVQKAEQIGGDGTGDLDGNQLRNNRDSIMPSLEFNCSGTITGFLLGVDVRRTNNNNNNYNKFENTSPFIYLWNKTGERDNYIRVDNSSVEIRLGSSNFSTDGVYQFSLSTPLQFTANQVLGIYQPRNRYSVVTFYYQDYNGQDIYETYKNEYTLDEYDKQMNRRPLIYPVTSIIVIIIY